MDDHSTVFDDERVFNPIQIICLDALFFCGILVAGLTSGLHWALSLLAAGFGGAVATLGVATVVCLLRSRRPERRRRQTTRSLRAAAEVADPLTVTPSPGMDVSDRGLWSGTGQITDRAMPPTSEDMLRVWYEDAQDEAQRHEAASLPEPGLKARASGR